MKCFSLSHSPDQFFFSDNQKVIAAAAVVPNKLFLASTLVTRFPLPPPCSYSPTTNRLFYINACSDSKKRKRGNPPMLIFRGIYDNFDDLFAVITKISKSVSSVTIIAFPWVEDNAVHNIPRSYSTKYVNYITRGKPIVDKEAMGKAIDFTPVNRVGGTLHTISGTGQPAINTWSDNLKLFVSRDEINANELSGYMHIQKEMFVVNQLVEHVIEKK
jgi:hypothetical protein